MYTKAQKMPQPKSSVLILIPFMQVLFRSYSLNNLTLEFKFLFTSVKTDYRSSTAVQTYHIYYLTLYKKNLITSTVLSK